MLMPAHLDSTFSLSFDRSWKTFLMMNLDYDPWGLSNCRCFTLPQFLLNEKSLDHFYFWVIWKMTFMLSGLSFLSLALMQHKSYFFSWNSHHNLCSGCMLFLMWEAFFSSSFNWVHTFPTNTLLLITKMLHLWHHVDFFIFTFWLSFGKKLINFQIGAKKF